MTSEKTQNRIAVLCLATYLIGGFLTFGYFYNNGTRQQQNGSFIIGIWWPVYWVGRLAIEVTK